MADLKRVGVELLATGADKFDSDTRAANKSILDLGESADKAAKGGFDRLHGAMGKLGSAALGFGKVVGGLALGGAVAGVGALGAAFVSGIGDAREAAKIMAQTEAVIKSTGGAAGVSAEHVADLAGALSAASGKSLFGDDLIQQSSNLLLTFTNLKGGVLDAATAMSVDMAQALGGAPADAALQLGKALNDPIAGIGALSRVGVTFTEQQKAQIKTMVEAGDVAGAQGVILAELNKEFGGSAEAAAKADGGMTQFKDSMGELAESVGARVLPALNGLMGWLNSPEVQAGITALVDGLVNGVTKIGEVIGTVTAAFQEGGLTGVFDLVLPKLQAFGSSVLTWISEQAPIWGAQLMTWGIAFGQWVLDALPGLMEKLGTLLQALLSWVSDNAPAWGEKLLTFGLAAVEWVTEAMGPLADKLGEFANKMLNWVADQLPGWGKKLAEFGEKAVGWVLDALPGLAKNLGTFAGKLIGWILQTVIDIVPKLAEMGAKFIGWVVTDVLPKLPGALAKIWDALVLFVQTASADIVPKLKDMAQKFLDWVKNDVLPFLSEKLDAILTGISDWVTGAAKDVAGYVVSIGTALVDGIKSGISSAWSGFLGWIDEKLALIPQSIRDFLGISSPARLMIPLGEAIPQGLQLGAERAFPGFQRSLIGGLRQTFTQAGQLILTEGGRMNDIFGGIVGEWNQLVDSIRQPFFSDISGGFVNRSPNWDTNDPGGSFSGAPVFRSPLENSPRYNAPDYTAKTIRPPASASQMAQAALVQNTNTVQYNWSPTYNNASRSPDQDYYLQRALTR